MRSNLLLFIMVLNFVCLGTVHAQNVVNILGGGARSEEFRFFERVPEIRLKNLESYRQRYIKIYYVVGSAPILDKQENILIREIKRIDYFQIEKNEHILPSVHIPKTGLLTTYNYVILVLTESPKYLLTNPDGSSVAGQESSQSLIQDAGARRFVFSRNQLLKPSVDAGIWEFGQPEPENYIPFIFSMP